MNIVVAVRAKHAGVAILGVFVHTHDIKGLQGIAFAHAHRKAFANGIHRAAANGLRDEFFRNAGQVSPGIGLIVHPAAIQDLRILVQRLQSRQIFAGNLRRDGGGRIAVFGNGGAAHLLLVLDMINLARKSLHKLLHHFLGDQIAV